MSFRRLLKIVALGAAGILVSACLFVVYENAYSISTAANLDRIEHAIQHPEILRHTLRYPGSPFLSCTFWRCLPWSPNGPFALRIAILTKSPKAITELLNMGVKPDEHIPWGYLKYRSPNKFNGAMETGIVSLTGQYRHAGVKDEWQPALCIADDQTIALLLLNAGANPNARDPVGNTPLLCTRDEKIAQLLIEHGANVNLANNEGETPFLKAVQEENYRLAEFYVRSGANIYASTRDGHTALTMVRDENFEMFNSSDKKLIFDYLLNNPLNYLDLRQTYLEALRRLNDKPAHQYEFLERQVYGEDNRSPSLTRQIRRAWGWDDLMEFERQHPEFIWHWRDMEWRRAQLAKE